MVEHKPSATVNFFSDVEVVQLCTLYTWVCMSMSVSVSYEITNLVVLAQANAFKQWLSELIDCIDKNYRPID